MELTVEQFEQFDRRLQAVEQGQRNLEQGQRHLEQKLEQGQRHLEQKLEHEIAASQTQIVRWVVGLFLGSMVIVTTLAGVYIMVLLAR